MHAENPTLALGKLIVSLTPLLEADLAWEVVARRLIGAVHQRVEKRLASQTVLTPTAAVDDPIQMSIRKGHYTAAADLAVTYHPPGCAAA